LKQRPYTKQRGEKMHFNIIAPEWQKEYDSGVFAKLWKDASAAIHRAKHVVFVGYSLPETDLHATALFRSSVKKDGLKSLIIVNPNREARKRTRTVLQRGITKNTKILSLEYLQHLNALGRKVWDY
jgi:hypothetical protein